MRKIIFALLLLGISFIHAQEKIDINTADLDELKGLPITDTQAEDIFDYRTYISFFRSIYQLREIESIDQDTLNRLKPLLIVSHYDEKDEIAQRRDEIYYLIERLGSNEGFQEGISDIWEDYLTSPRNINKLSFAEVLNMPNVSQIDALAIIDRTARGDSISNYRDLRGSQGISYYGASNLRHYVYYQNRELEKKLIFDYQFKYNDSPYDDDARDMLKESMIRMEEIPHTTAGSYWGYFDMKTHSAATMSKLRMRYRDEWKAGILYNNPKGEPSLFDRDASEILDNSKYFVGYEKEIDLLGRNLISLTAGNYRATFGEGLIMENTDYYTPRKTGHGFNKRITGIIGDMSRSHEYALRGIALDWKRKDLNAVFFFSQDKKDAVVYDSNGDGEINGEDDMLSYITMTHRFANDQLREVEDYFNDYEGNDNYISIAPRLDAFEETIIGGHVEYSPLIGTHLGFTGYEATYDRDFTVPEGDALKELLLYIETGGDIDENWRYTDKELAALYSTKSAAIGDRNYRRVYGFDWRTVIGNTSFQGEYAELEVDGTLFKLGDDPKAYILSFYSQFENLYFLTVYRHYDLAFDNPYQRSFSESERYDDTVVDRLTYGLNNTLLTDMYLNSAQPSAERGVYFETRYRFHEKLTLTRVYLDIWERMSDNRKGVRFEGKLEYRPLHQFRIISRYKIQNKRYDDDLDRNKSQNVETEFDFIFNLSNFDRLVLGYFHVQTDQPPYLSILSDPAQPGGPDIAQANTRSKGDMIFVDYTHNFNENLKIIGSVSVWKCNGASIWDFEDVELDFNNSDRGFKYWIHLHSRISSNVFLSLKFKYKQFLTREYEFRYFNEIPESGEYYFDRVEKKETTIRMQLDWKF